MFGKFRWMILALGVVALAIPNATQAQQVPGPHPAYLHALTDLRTARHYLHDGWAWGPVKHDDDEAIREIDAAINEIDAALKRKQGRVAVTALHGLRGVGKTTLAAAYADLHRTEYRATWWIRAQTDSTMPADLVALGVQLGWVAADEKEEPALTKVRERLRHECEGLLLIYDNAIDAESREELPTERFLWSRSSWYDNPSYRRPNHGQRQGGDHARSGNSGAGGQPRFAASFSQPQSRHPNRASGKARARGRRAVGGGMRQARRDRREGFG